MDAISGMRILSDETVDPAGFFATEIKKGQVLRILDIEGQQVADLVTLNAGNMAEKISVMNTISLNRQVFPRVGYVLYSDEANAMVTIIADTCGVHDMLAGACTALPTSAAMASRTPRTARTTWRPRSSPGTSPGKTCRST
jgi:uncharacterized protein YcgI (DUF1989 family)